MEGDQSDKEDIIKGSIDLQTTLSPTRRGFESHRVSHNASPSSFTKSPGKPIKISDGLKVNQFNRVLKQAIQSPKRKGNATPMRERLDLSELTNQQF